MCKEHKLDETKRTHVKKREEKNELHERELYSRVHDANGLIGFENQNKKKELGIYSKLLHQPTFSCNLSTRTIRSKLTLT